MFVAIFWLDILVWLDVFLQDERLDCIDSQDPMFLWFYNFSIFFSFFPFSMFCVRCEQGECLATTERQCRGLLYWQGRSRCRLGSGERGTIWPVLAWLWQSLSSHITHTQSYLSLPPRTDWLTVCQLMFPTSSTQPPELDLYWWMFAVSWSCRSHLNFYSLVLLT